MIGAVIHMERWENSEGRPGPSLIMVAFRECLPPTMYHTSLEHLLCAIYLLSTYFVPDSGLDGGGREQLNEVTLLPALGGLAASDPDVIMVEVVI